MPAWGLICYWCIDSSGSPLAKCRGQNMVPLLRSLASAMSMSASNRRLRQPPVKCIGLNSAYVSVLAVSKPSLSVMFMILSQDRTDRYIARLGKGLVDTLFSTTAMADLVDFSLLKCKQRDQLEETFRSWDCHAPCNSEWPRPRDSARVRGKLSHQ